MPVSVRLAWWGTAWLRGAISPDDFLDGALGDDVTHVVDGEALLGAAASVRALGAHSFGAAHPVESDPVGLGGPAALNHAAIDAGGAVLVLGAGLAWVPRHVGPTVEWTTYRADRRQVPDVGEADRELRSALPVVADALAALDVARWRPEAADALMNLRRLTPVAAPRGIPERCVDLMTRGLALLDVVELALLDDGAAVSASQIQQRRDALMPLARSARRAVTAAASPEGWPP